MSASPTGRAPRHRLLRLGGGLLLAALLGWGCAGGRQAPSPGPEPGAEPDAAETETEPEARPEPVPPDRYYWTYVASEAADVVSRLRFGPGGAVYEKGIRVGSMPGRPDGLGELAFSPDGAHWYLTVAGGATPGSVWKYETGTDRMAGRIQLQGSPGSVALSPEDGSAYVTLGPDGGAGPAAVAVLRAAEMAEAARMATCREARASRMHPSGRWQYSVCRADDRLVEVSTDAPGVSRTARLTGDGRCGPADLALSEDGDRLYVACGAGRSLLVLERDDLELERRTGLGAEPVDVAVVPGDGRLLILLDDEQALVVLDDEGEEVRARIPLSAPRPSSLSVSDDGRYAFVTLRGRPGAPRSTVEVVDLVAMTGVATIEVPEGASASAFWRSVAAKR